MSVFIKPPLQVADVMDDAIRMTAPECLESTCPQCGCVVRQALIVPQEVAEHLDVLIECAKRYIEDTGVGEKMRADLLKRLAQTFKVKQEVDRIVNDENN